MFEFACFGCNNCAYVCHYGVAVDRGNLLTAGKETSGEGEVQTKKCINGVSFATDVVVQNKTLKSVKAHVAAQTSNEQPRTTRGDNNSGK